MISEFSAREPRQFDGERTVCTTNGAGTTGCPFIKNNKAGFLLYTIHTK